MTDPRKPPIQPRKIPAQARSQETVAILLEAAAQVLEARGLEGFNTNEIAKRAGVSIGSLYQYFPSKDAMVLALMHREKERFHDDALRALDAATGRDAMTFLIEAAVRQQLSRPDLALLLDTQESQPLLREETRVMNRFTGLIRQILSRPDLPPQRNCDVAAHDLGAIIRGMTDGAGERLETDMRDLQRRVHAAVLGYLERESAAPPR